MRSVVTFGQNVSEEIIGKLNSPAEAQVSGLLIDDISMRFELPNGGSVQALKNVTLDIASGELMSVLGPSGCGKTTLLNIVAGFLAPTEGRVVLNDETVVGPSPERGMVFQQGALFEWMSAVSYTHLTLPTKA